MKFKPNFRPTKKKVIFTLIIPLLLGLFLSLTSNSDVGSYRYYFPLPMYQVDCGLIINDDFRVSSNSCEGNGWLPLEMLINLILIILIYTIASLFSRK